MAAEANSNHSNKSDKSNLGIFPSYLVPRGKSLTPDEILAKYTFIRASPDNRTWEEIQAAKPDLDTPRVEPSDDKKYQPHNWVSLQSTSLDQIRDVLPRLIESMGATHVFNPKTFGYECLTPPDSPCLTCVDVKQYNCKYCIGTKWQLILYEKKDTPSQFVLEFVKGRGCGFHSMKIHSEFKAQLKDKNV
jgi:hypothetical protein